LQAFAFSGITEILAHRPSPLSGDNQTSLLSAMKTTVEASEPSSNMALADRKRENLLANRKVR